MKQILPKAQFLIEVLHEVANPIGGVYTVVATKSNQMRKYYGDNYWTIGAYYPKHSKLEFDEKEPLEDMRYMFDRLEKDRIFCHFGNWIISGKPKAVLIDYSRNMRNLSKIKKRLKKDYNIDAKNCGSDLDKQIVWSDCTSKFFEKFLNLDFFKNKKGVIHFHLSDPGLLLLDLAKKNVSAGLLYTAHSTRLGRYIAMNKEDLLSEIKKNRNKVVQKGREYKYGGMVKTVHQFERACANAADVFTSVSEVTAREAEYILGKKTDIVTPNGLDMSSFPLLEERSALHNKSKNKIYRFLNAYFSPYQNIDLKDSALLFTSGRYELTTKGYDILFDALGKLNICLKKENYDKNIFVFLFIMQRDSTPNKKVLENLTIYDAIEHEVEKEFPHLRNRIMNALLYGRDLKHEDIFDEHFLTNTRKLILKFRQHKNESAPICGLECIQKKDPLLKSLSKNGLNNNESDRIKVIFYPAPLSVFRPRTNPLLTKFNTKNGTKYVWTTFSNDQIDLNFKNPEVLIDMMEILLFYISKGVEIIRLDAIAYLWKELGTTCIHLKKTHEIIKLIRSILNYVAPYAIIITETNVPPKENISYFGNGKDEAQLVYKFLLPPLVLYAFACKDTSYLQKAYKMFANLKDSSLFLNFLASHDGIGILGARKMLSAKDFRILPKTVKKHQGLISYKSTKNSKITPYELNINYFDAINNPHNRLPAEKQVNRFIASQAIMLFSKGIPGIYIHSLLGSRNNLKGAKITGIKRDINRQELQYKELDKQLRNKNSIRHKVLSNYLHLIDSRKKITLLDPYCKEKPIKSDERLLITMREYKGKKIIVIINVSDNRINLQKYANKVNLITIKRFNGEVAPYGVYCLVINI